MRIGAALVAPVRHAYPIRSGLRSRGSSDGLACDRSIGPRAFLLTDDRGREAARDGVARGGYARTYAIAALITAVSAIWRNDDRSSVHRSDARELGLRLGPLPAGGRV